MKIQIIVDNTQKNKQIITIESSGTLIPNNLNISDLFSSALSVLSQEGLSNPTKSKKESKKK